MKVLGYMVLEVAEGIEQPLALLKDQGKPEGGVLTWADEKIAVFPDRTAARSAITRTEHYRLAFNSLAHPVRQFCKIRSVVAA